VGLVETFCKKWNPNDYEEWMPYVEKMKEMFGVINKKNLVEEAPQSTFEDDETMDDLVASPLEEHIDEEFPHDD
jgi:predicted transcriptional regulator